MLNPRVIQSSVEETPGDGPIGRNVMTLMLASVADDIIPWGPGSWAQRDQQLRSFFTQESVLQSAIYSVVASNAALSWELEGPPATVDAVSEMLHAANFGAGWVNFMTQVSLDLLTQDNGAFIEIIRDGPAASNAVLGLQHLDALRCVRTGNPETPVVYWDTKNRPHKMRWWQIIPLAEFPSALENAKGLQYSAITRCLRAAQIIRSINLYTDEKVSGRNIKAIHFVSGIESAKVQDAIQQAKLHAEDKGLLRYWDPVIVASIDQSESISVQTIELAGLPDHFNFDDSMRWYITQLAMALGRDYQDFAPLPSGNLGSGAQSQVLARKTRGKGPALFMKIVAHALNVHGVVPNNAVFRFDEPDAELEAEREEAATARAERHEIYIANDILTPDVSRQILQDMGDLPEDVHQLMGAADRTPNVQVDDDDQADTRAKHLRKRKKKRKKKDDDDDKPTRRRPTGPSYREADDDPDDRDERLRYAEETNRYQGLMLGATRAWTRRTVRELKGLDAVQVRAALPARLASLRKELGAVKDQNLPRAFNLARRGHDLTQAEIDFVDARVQAETETIESVYVPLAESLVMQAVDQAEAAVVAGGGA